MSLTLRLCFVLLVLCKNLVKTELNSTINPFDDDLSDENSSAIVDQSSENEELTTVLKFATECETPNYDPGYCLDIIQCPLLYKQRNNNEAQEFLVASKCGPKNEDQQNPKVCCGKFNNFRRPNKVLDDTTIFPKKCGKRFPVVLHTRILGGTKAAIGEFPWMARLVHKNKRGYKTVGCSGFLIHTKYVITAAHCVHEKFIQIRGPVFSVILGEHNTETKIDCNPMGTYCADPLQISRVAKVIVHPGYDVDSSGHYNDIALIHMKKAARITDFVQPICLQTDQGEIPESYVISGWGKTETEMFSKIKMKVELPAVKKSECSGKYNVIGIELLDSQICAGGEKDKDSCVGDSGGPLMMENGTNYLAAGLVSYGFGCGVENWPGVYTSIPSFMPWIKQEIIKNSITTRNPAHKGQHKKKIKTNQQAQ